MTDLDKIELVSYHAKKIYLFIWDIYYCVAAAPTKRNDDNDRKILIARACDEIIKKEEIRQGLKESYSYLSKFLEEVHLTKAIQSLGIDTDFNIDFYPFILEIVNNNRNTSSYYKKNEISRNMVADLRVVCSVFFKIASYLRNEDNVKYIEYKIAFLEDYKSKLEDLIQLNNHWILSDYNYSAQFKITNGDNSFNPLWIETEINILKSELITSRNDQTKNDRALLASLAVLFIENGFENINKAINLIAASTVIDNYIDQRTVSRIISKAKSNNIKKQEVLVGYDNALNEKRDRMRSIIDSQMAYKYTHREEKIFMNPLAGRRSFMLNKFNYEFELLKIKDKTM
ncbi:hypothetical protein AB7W46_08875 [Providencia rettgeri]|nr:hypothetical protein [Providencia rettgeri]ELL9150907.1 hypothetical protein [Providencia rettgeri]ELR5090167.1 hypothetical protein [Providencia rettgeri]